MPFRGRWYTRAMARTISIHRRALGAPENPMDRHADLSPGERMALVWEITQQALAFQGTTDAELRLSRHSVRVVRRQG